MVPECQSEVVAGVPDAAKSNEGQQYVGLAENVCLPFAEINVWNKCIMTRNSMTDMVNEASDVEGATGGKRGVTGGSVEMTSGIDSAAGAGGTDSTGSSSCCSACGGTGDAGLGGAATGAE